MPEARSDSPPRTAPSSSAASAADEMRTAQTIGLRPPQQDAALTDEQAWRPAIAADPPVSSASEPADGDAVSVGSLELHWGSSLQRMRDSSALFRAGRVAEWTYVLKRDGYLLLRGLLPPHKVLAARQCVCEALHHDWQRVDTTSAAALAEAPTAEMLHADRRAEAAKPDQPLSDAALQRLFASTPLLRARIKPVDETPASASSAASSPRLHPGVLLTGYRPVTHDPRVLSVLEGPELASLFSQLFGQLQREELERDAPSMSGRALAAEQALGLSAATPASSSASPHAAASTFDTKWCRVHSQGELTEEHTDYYRFEHFSSRLDESSREDAAGEEDGAKSMFTCWIPLGCYPISHGTLAVAEGSHKLSGYRRGVYGSAECKAELPPDFDAWTQGSIDERSGVASSPGVWRTSSFLPGDVVVFDIRLVHASTRNSHEHFRLSLDTRWKPTALLLEEQRDAFTQVHVSESRSERP